VLFVQLYLIYYLGVYHRDLKPRNVVRKGWCRLKIIDFAFSNVNHTCPGWRECSELKSVWHELQLDKLAFFHKSVTPGTSRFITGIICGVFLLSCLFSS
jgi:serine/threonine protein kinase